MGWFVREAECEHSSGEERTFYSIEPDFGPKHEPHPDCWCHPDIDSDDVVIHNAAN